MNRLLELPLFVRIVACVIALSAIMVLLACKIFPGIPLLVAFAWVIGVIAVAGVLLIVYFVVIAGWNTWSLDHGMTDTQWLWFDGEPSGLQKSRDDGNSVLRKP